MDDDFTVFIISHGRPDNIKTLKTLKKCGYTGPIYIVCDDLDKSLDQYIKKFGDMIKVFDKQKIANQTDQGDNFNNLRTTTHCRNACFEIAESIGYKYFLVLDDDYTSFKYIFDHEFKYHSCSIKNMDNVIKIFLNYFKSNKQLSSICFAQGGDLIGGSKGENVLMKKITVKRKAMNSFFCSTDRKFKFIGRLNEDVNTYVSLNSIGKLFFTTSLITLDQTETQANSGGMTDSYLESGTYVKSFYSVMYQPSSVKISRLKNRIHHRIFFKNNAPMILNPKWRKNDS
jgi:hypothetical protein